MYGFLNCSKAFVNSLQEMWSYIWNCHYQHLKVCLSNISWVPIWYKTASQCAVQVKDTQFQLSGYYRLVKTQTSKKSVTREYVVTRVHAGALIAHRRIEQCWSNQTVLERCESKKGILVKIKPRTREKQVWARPRELNISRAFSKKVCVEMNMCSLRGNVKVYCVSGIRSHTVISQMMICHTPWFHKWM